MKNHDPAFSRSVGDASAPALRRALAQDERSDERAEVMPDRSKAIDKAYNEFCELLEGGANPDPDEFCATYPAIKTSLLRCIRLHDSVDIDPEAIPATPTKPKTPAAPWPRPGAWFLRLRLLRELGRGAFSRVFLAEEPALGNRRVAVKIARGGAQEARTLGRLDHPNIVPIYSVEEDLNTGFTAVCMPYQGRATLCDVMDAAFAGRVPPTRASAILAAVSDEPQTDHGGAWETVAAEYRTGTYADGVAHIALQLAEALQLVHARGVHHLDLKLSNVLVTPRGKPMLLDFNLSRDARLGSISLGGTLPYMSPEQLRASERGDADDWHGVDARSDLYSLGVILYELMSGHHPMGRVPFRLSSPKAHTRLLERQSHGPIPLSRVNPNMERELAAIIERCLAFEPAARYASAAQLADALRRRASRKRRRGRVRRALIAGCAAVALIVAGGAALAKQSAERDQLFRDGAASYKRGQLQDSVDAFSRLLKAEPNNARAYYARGRAHQRLNNIAAALADFQKADTLAPDGRTKACIAYCQARLQHRSEAIEVSTEAIEAGFASAAVSNNLGFCYLKNGQSGPAELFLNAAIKKDPALQPAFFNRALADLQKAIASRKKRQFPRRGIADIEAAIKLGPPSPELFRLAGFIHAAAAEIKDRKINATLAVEYLRKAVEHGLDINRWKDDATLRGLSNDLRFLEITRIRPTALAPLDKDVGLQDPVADAAD